MHAGKWSFDTIRRHCHKWAMCGYKGGECIRCGVIATWGDLEKFHFDHKQQINDRNNHDDRWSYWRDVQPFIPEWREWADSVDLVCEECHYQRHNGRKQLRLNLEVQARLDGYAEHGMIFVHQPSLLDNPEE